MAFGSPAKINTLQDVVRLLDEIRTIYELGTHVQSMLAIYQANSDPVLTAAVNALFTSAERTEIGQMLSQIDALVTNWAAQHPNVIGP